MERWRPIDGYEGYYEVSDQGRVRSLDRQVLGPRGDYINLRGRLMTPVAQASGHLNVNLSKSNVQKSYRVHRLVLLAFGPPIPGSEYQVMHIDDDPTNNHVKNLRWGTCTDNMRDMCSKGRHRGQVRTHCPRGHELTGNNLVSCELARGRRKCRACHQARSTCSRMNDLSEENWQRISDIKYQALEPVAPTVVQHINKQIAYADMGTQQQPRKAT